jgi:hypothetical protein
MNVVGIKFNGAETMCKNCGDCTKQHEWSIDDGVDSVEDQIV